MTVFIIDPPTYFAPLSEWRDFIKRLERLQKENPDNSEINDALTFARGHVGQG